VAALSRRPDLASIEAARALFGWMFPASFVAGCGLALALARRTRIAAFGCLLVATPLAASLALLEAAAALKLVHWRVVCVRAGLPCDTVYSLIFQSDAELAMRRPADARWTEPALADIENGWSLPLARRATLAFTYDSLGFRNPPGRPPAAEVALIGDSYIEGAYNDDAEVVARRLEARLGRPVANLGVAGYGTLQQLIVLDRLAPHFAPKVVVWFFFEGNDLYDDREYAAVMKLGPEFAARGQGREGMRAHHGWEVRSFSVNAFRLLRRWADPAFPNRAPHAARLALPGRAGETVLFADYARWPWTDVVAADWARAREAFRKGVALARARGVRLVLAFAPIKFRVYRPYVDIPPGDVMHDWTLWPIRELFAEFCVAEAVACLDLTGPFQNALAAGGRPFAPTDTHWSAEGHDLVAQAVKARLDELAWLE
jgi:hypothetical protein